MNENDLINKLLISKKIMEKHNEIPRAGNTNLGLSSLRKQNIIYQTM